jgi:hypothetical protein
LISQLSLTDIRCTPWKSQNHIIGNIRALETNLERTTANSVAASPTLASIAFILSIVSIARKIKSEGKRTFTTVGDGVHL